MRVADNPHKPGTDAHREWEMDNIHAHRMFWTDAYADAKAAADARLSALKASCAHVDTSVDDLLDEMAHINDPPREMVGVSASGYTTGRFVPATGAHFISVVNGLDLSQYFTSAVLHLDPMPTPDPDYYHWLLSPSAWDDDHQVHGRADIMTTATVGRMFDHDTPDALGWGQSEPEDATTSPGSTARPLGGPTDER